MLLLVWIVLNILFILRASVEENIFYVLFCKHRPFEPKFVPKGDCNIDIEEKCNCKSGLCHEVCGFCFSVRYLLNLKCHKVCVDEVPDYFDDKVVPLDTSLKKMNCDPFFFLSSEIRLVKVSLEYPYEDKIPAKTDYRYFFSFLKKILKRPILGNSYVPTYACGYNKLPWYERDLIAYFNYLDY